jgi:hypothetical protein
MPVAPTVKWLRLGGEAPEVSAAVVSARCAQHQQTSEVCGGGGLKQYQPTAADGPQRRLFKLFAAFFCGPPLTGSVRQLSTSREGREKQLVQCRS